MSISTAGHTGQLKGGDESKLSQLKHAAMDKACQVQHAVQDRAETLMDGVKDAGAEIKQRAQAGVESLRDVSSEYWDEGKACAKEMTTRMERQIQKAPLTSILVAAGVGLIVGAIVFRR